MMVFLSYSKPDEPWARQIASGLEKAGFEVWDANRRVLPGGNWALEIAEALKRSEAMVVLISPHSGDSQSVRREIEYALASRSFQHRLVPVIVRPTRKIPWILRRLQHVRLRDDPERAAREIVEILRAPEKPEVPTPRAAAH
jgi:hypothetical protein